MLDHDAREQFPVIVIDASDECGGLRHDSSGRRDHQVLLHTIERWGQVDHLKKFKLVITSRPDEDIERKLPEIVNSLVNIPSGSDVKPGDSASNDIRAYLKYRLDESKMRGSGRLLIIWSPALRVCSSGQQLRFSSKKYCTTIGYPENKEARRWLREVQRFVSAVHRCCYNIIWTWS